MVQLESRIHAVTVYHQGARVTRAVTLQPVDGRAPAVVELVRLPLALFDPTVRARVLDVQGPGAQLQATTVRVGLFIPPRGSIPETPDQALVRETERRIAVLRDEDQQLEHEENLLSQVPVPDRAQPLEGHAPTPSPVRARLKLEDFLAQGRDRRTARRRQLRAELETASAELAALQHRIALASRAQEVRPDDLFKSVQLQLQLLHTGAAFTGATLLLDYFVPGARWLPAYQCRVSRDCTRAELLMRAHVAQASGEDWTGARLTLSTAQPLSWTELPDLPSLRIGRAQPPPAARPPRPPPTGASQLFADLDRDTASASRLLPQITPFRPPEFLSFSGGESAPKGGRARSRGDTDEVMLLGSSGGARMQLEEPMAMDMAADDSDSFESEAPPPPPPPPAPPPRTPPSMAKAAMAPAAKPAPAGLAERARMVMADAAMEAPDGGPPQAVLELVAYAQLRLGPPRGNNRGRLQPVAAREAYQETLRRYAGVTFSFDPTAVVRQAEERARAVVRQPLPLGTSDVRATASNFDFAWTTLDPVDIPADGGFHSIPVVTGDGSCDVLYVVVPRVDTSVFRQASVQNPLPGPLLPGPAEIYVGGEYVLSTTLPLVAPGAVFALGLGVEQAIKCARNTRYAESRSGSKVVATHELTHDLSIELVSNLDRVARLEVRERIPQPAPNAEVVVEEGHVEPAWEKYSQEERGQVLEGGRRWKLEVPPRGTRTLNAQYVVKIYANNELVGGNRREA